MLHHGVQPDKVTFVSVLAACSNQALLAEGKEIHAWTLISGVEPDINVGNALISMYVKCGNLEDARRVFGRMQERDVISWTSLITVCAENGKSNEVLELFDQMQKEGVTPNKITFVNLVTVFANEAALAKGECIHSCIIKRGFEPDVVVANALINMYCKCDSLEDARRVFDKMHDQNVVSWSSIITMYAQQEQCEEAFELFYQMQQVGISPNNVTFSGILDACSSLAEGKQIHASIQERGCESDVVVGTALIKMYSKCGSLKDAHTMFDKICEPDVVTWNAIIAAYTDNEQGKESFQLFDQMQGGGAMPNKATFYCLLAACSSQEFLIEGVRMHARLMCIESNSDVLMATSLVNMYGKCRSPTKAYELFDKMLQRSVASWTAMIAVYAENGQDRKALQLFEQMQSECILPNKITFVIALMACANQAVLVRGKRLHAYIVESGFVSDVVVGNALISMYGKCGSLKDARGTFDNIVMRNVVSWTGMIAAYVQHGEGMEAMQLYCQMQNQGVLPNRVTFVSILDAYAIQTALFEGKRLHACMLDEFESDIDVGNAMVNMYGKCGCLEYAWRIFSSMAEGDSFLWNAIIGVYAEHGKGKEALQLVERMRLEGFMPDEVTIVNTLVACSHAGLVDEGCCYISYMLQGQDLSPDLYPCIIDLLGRAGLLEVAENLINDMPFQPTIISFMALLGACRYQADVERGKRAAKHLFELDPKNTAPSYVLSQVYTSASSRENLAKLMGDYM